MSNLIDYLLPSLVQKFPVFDPRWSDELRERWMHNYEQLWRATIAADGGRQAEPRKQAKRPRRRWRRCVSLYAHTAH